MHDLPQTRKGFIFQFQTLFSLRFSIASIKEEDVRLLLISAIECLNVFPAYFRAICSGRRGFHYQNSRFDYLVSVDYLQGKKFWYNEII
jgi:hypothetical protein